MPSPPDSGHKVLIVKSLEDGVPLQSSSGIELTHRVVWGKDLEDCPRWRCRAFDRGQR
jgi:hypothetical protein